MCADDFGGDAHADGACAEGLEGADFGASFVAGAVHPVVGAGGVTSGQGEIGGDGLGEVEGGVAPGEDAVDGDEASRWGVALEASGGIGEDDGVDAEAFLRGDGGGDGVEVESLVDVYAAALYDHAGGSGTADDELPGVAFDVSGGHSGETGEGALLLDHVEDLGEVDAGAGNEADGGRVFQVIHGEGRI